MVNLITTYIIPAMSKIFRNILFITLTLLLFLASPGISFSQMFSVGDPEPTQTRVTGIYSVIGLGWEIGSFTYTGSSSPENDRLDFDDSLISLSLESPGLDLSVTLGGKFTGMSEQSYLNLTGRLYNLFPVYQRDKFVLYIPLQLTTDLKRVRKEITDFEFQQSSLSIGSGLSSATQLSNNIDFTIKATPNYGFSFSQGNLFGGNIFQMDGKAKLFFKNLIGSNALSIGYHFDYRTYNIDGDLSDYDYISHSIIIGYAF